MVHSGGAIARARCCLEARPLLFVGTAGGPCCIAVPTALVDAVAERVFLSIDVAAMSTLDLRGLVCSKDSAVCLGLTILSQLLGAAILPRITCRKTCAIHKVKVTVAFMMMTSIYHESDHTIE